MRRVFLLFLFFIVTGSLFAQGYAGTYAGGAAAGNAASSFFYNLKLNPDSTFVLQKISRDKSCRFVYPGLWSLSNGKCVLKPVAETERPLLIDFSASHISLSDPSDGTVFHRIDGGYDLPQPAIQNKAKRKIKEPDCFKF